MSMSHFCIQPLEPRQLFVVLIPAQTVTSSITTLAQQKNWTMPLKAGQQVIIAVGDTGTTTFAPDAALIDPSGKVVATSAGNAGAFINTTPLVTGTYRLRVRDIGNDQLGAVKVTAFYYATTITDNDDAFFAESGRRRAGTIGPGDLDVWRVPAKSGQFISTLVSNYPAGSPVDVQYALIKPDGKALVATTTIRKIDIQANTFNGNYYVVISEKGQDETGRYGISAAMTPGVQYAGDPDTVTPLVSGVTRAGDMPAGDMDVWNMSLTAGKRFTVNLSRLNGGLKPELVLVDSLGKIVAQSKGLTSTTLSYNVPKTGTYWLISRDSNADDGGQYNIVYTLV